MDDTHHKDIQETGIGNARVLGTRQRPTGGQPMDRSRPGTLLPWLVPLVLVAAVLIAVVANLVVLGVVVLLIGYVGIPVAYRAYLRTKPKRDQRDGRADEAS